MYAMANYILGIAEAQTMCENIKAGISVSDTIVTSGSDFEEIANLDGDVDTITLIIDLCEEVDKQVLKCVGLIRGVLEDVDTTTFTNFIPLKLIIKSRDCNNECDCN